MEDKISNITARSYCYECDIHCKKFIGEEFEKFGDEGKLYVHDICPKCYKKFYSPAKPKKYFK